jgi:3-hydroxyisobutyrate dehydrogenase-like beta-hydroxyacid dehydrogenase
MTERVGLIGVGAMGEALLSRIQMAGGTAKVFDVSDERLALARAAGALVEPSVSAAVDDVSFVHVFVRTDDEVEAVVAGSGGVFSAAGPGTVVLLHATILPETTRRIGGEALRGVRVIDAPVTSVPRVVAQGKAVFLTGGADEDVARARPWLEKLGRAVYHFGPLGAGNVAKIAKNMITANERIALAEVAELVSAGGVGVEQFLDMAREVDQGSSVARWRSAFNMEGNHAVPRPASNLLNKDIALAAELAHKLKVAVPMTDAAAATAKVWVKGWENDGK